MTGRNDLDVLDPASTPVTFDGRSLALRPLKVGVVPAIVRVAKPIIEDLASRDLLLGTDGGVDLDLGSILSFIGEHGDAIFEAVSLATGLPVEELQEGDIGEFVVLAKAVVGVNRDFFTRTLVPLLAGLARGSRGAGPTPSSS